MEYKEGCRIKEELIWGAILAGLKKVLFLIHHTRFLVCDLWSWKASIIIIFIKYTTKFGNPVPVSHIFDSKKKHTKRQKFSSNHKINFKSQ